MSWQFATAGRVLFGRGEAARVGAACIRLGITRPLLVSDAQLAGLGLVAAIEKSLLESCFYVTCFTGCVAEPPISCAEAAAQVGRDADIDGIIALGGGSNMDVAKVVAAILEHGGSPKDYFGFDRVPGPVLPLIALPTTAGTGSEVSHSAVLSDLEAGLKVSTLSPHLRPAMAIIDPALTDSCPPTVTAHSGIDALVHAIEAFTARSSEEMPEQNPLARVYDGSNRFTRLLASEAIRLVGRSLVRAVCEGKNKQARDEMALAAMLAGMAFSNSGVAVVHALEYPIGILTHCSHGEGNGLLLPHVMRFNAAVCPREIASIGELLAGRQGTELEDSGQSGVDATIDRIVELQKAIGIRTTLRELDMVEADLPAVARKAHGVQRLMDTNPRRPTELDLLQILRSAF